MPRCGATLNDQVRGLGWCTDASRSAVCDRPQAANAIIKQGLDSHDHHQQGCCTLGASGLPGPYFALVEIQCSALNSVLKSPM